MTNYNFKKEETVTDSNKRLSNAAKESKRKRKRKKVLDAVQKRRKENR